jgi:hypothetical protein
MGADSQLLLATVDCHCMRTTPSYTNQMTRKAQPGQITNQQCDHVAFLSCQLRQTWRLEHHYSHSAITPPPHLLSLYMLLILSSRSNMAAHSRSSIS